VIGALIPAADYAIAGNGILRLSWDQCDPVVQNKNWAGPILYSLVLSVSDADVTNLGHRTKVKIGPKVAPAWRFDANDCNSGQLFVTHNDVSKTCLAFQGEDPLGLNQYRYELSTGIAVLDVTNVYPEGFTPVAAERYTLYQATFDHFWSDVGPQDPSIACGFVEEPLCFVLQIHDTEIVLPPFPGHKVAFSGVDNAVVTWQATANPIACEDPVQGHQRTWGRLKGLYR
jgi:hypothetical protein